MMGTAFMGYVLPWGQKVVETPYIEVGQIALSRWFWIPLYLVRHVNLMLEAS